jgi:valyl-tRNA synthetase
MMSENEKQKERWSKENEAKWQEYWEKEKIYAFDKNSDKKTFSVDTPPPTVSGDVHIGHAFSYSQQDFIVRYHRMKGENVFYPFGTDNNGVATERLIEKRLKIKSRDMSREEFRDICLKELKNKFDTSLYSRYEKLRYKL